MSVIFPWGFCPTFKFFKFSKSLKSSDFLKSDPSLKCGVVFSLRFSFLLMSLNFDVFLMEHFFFDFIFFCIFFFFSCL